MTELARKLAELRKERRDRGDDLLAPMRGLYCGLALIVPFWAAVGLAAWTIFA